jgi:hypothetical protein
VSVMSSVKRHPIAAMIFVLTLPYFFVRSALAQHILLDGTGLCLLFSGIAAGVYLSWFDSSDGHRDVKYGIPNTPANQAIVEELALLREFYKNVYWYIGSYPNWKVQQEYRQLLTTLEPNSNITAGDQAPYHLHNIDAYLTKLVNESNKLADIFPELPGSHNQIDLDNRRGNPYLDQIIERHSTAVKYESEKKSDEGITGE